MRTNLLLLFFLCLISCNQNNQPTEAQLIGKWNIVSATAEGMPTKRLDSGYFVFQDDNMAFSNLPSMEEKTKFTYSNGKINFGDDFFSLTIDQFINDTMLVSTTVQKELLEITLVKSKE